MADKPYNPEQITRAIEAFEAQQASAAEALMASVKLMTKSLARFRAEADAFRKQAGEERTRDFATEEFNDLVYEIQDSVPVAVRIFNGLMRESNSEKDPPGE